MDRLTIGEVAKQAHVRIETLRYYEQMGLVAPPPRNGANYRLYPQETVRRVQFIKRAQQLGFTLAEVEGLLLLEDGQSCRETRLLAEQKLALIEQRIADLTRMRRLLNGLIAKCRDGKRPTSCPIIETLSAGVEQRDNHGIR